MKQKLFWYNISFANSKLVRLNFWWFVFKVGEKSGSKNALAYSRQNLIDDQKGLYDVAVNEAFPVYIWGPLQNTFYYGNELNSIVS